MTQSAAQSVLIPVEDHRGHVYDPVRGLLYITTARGILERYDVYEQVLLTPWAIGTTLRGADITPDASALYVCEAGIWSLIPVTNFVRRNRVW